MSLPNLKQHIVLMQANMNRPIMASTPAYFKHPELKHLVHNPDHGMGLNYPPAPSMPPFMIEARKAEYEEDMRRAEEQAFHGTMGDVAEGGGWYSRCHGMFRGVVSPPEMWTRCP